MLQASHTSPRKLMSLIGSMASMEKTIPLGYLHMRPLQWYLKTHWRYAQSLDILVPVSQVLKEHLVDQSFKLKEGFPTSSEGAQSPSVHRCFPKRLGCSLKASHSQWSVESGGVKASHSF